MLRPIENRMELPARAGERPIACKTWDGCIDPTMQAEPLEAQTPSMSSAMSRLSALDPGNVMFAVFQSRGA